MRGMPRGQAEIDKIIHHHCAGTAGFLQRERNQLFREFCAYCPPRDKLNAIHYNDDFSPLYFPFLLCNMILLRVVPPDAQPGKIA